MTSSFQLELSRNLRIRTLLALSVFILASAAFSVQRGESRIRSQKTDEQPEAGRWRELPTTPGQKLTEEQRRVIAQLEALGYAAGSTTAAQSGITVDHRERSWPGLNLYSAGHAPEAILMDMQGNQLHSWRMEFPEIWPDSPHREAVSATWWRRVYLYPNGELLAIFEGHGLIKLDKHSNLLWQIPNRAHHDLEVLPSGDILVLTRRAHIVPWLDPTKPVLEDFITVMDAMGNEKSTLSILEVLRQSEYRDLLLQTTAKNGDVTHTNTLHYLDGRSWAMSSAFREGNLLVAMNRLGLVAVINPGNGRIEWAMKSEPFGHHDPNMLENENILLFENRKDSGLSVVVEIEPESKARVWEYSGAPDRPFFSKTCGAAQRLPNGNTLITESDGGRAFEVDEDGEIVWEFYVPYRTGQENQYIATLAELIRLPADFPIDWIPAVN